MRCTRFGESFDPAIDTFVMVLTHVNVFLAHYRVAAGVYGIIGLLAT